jgi:hypothetical protein
MNRFSAKNPAILILLPKNYMDQFPINLYSLLFSVNVSALYIKRNAYEIETLPPAYHPPHLIECFISSLRGAARRGNPGSKFADIEVLDCFAFARNDGGEVVTSTAKVGAISLSFHSKRRLEG